MSVLMEPGEEEMILEGVLSQWLTRWFGPSLFFIGILVFSPRVIARNDVIRLQTMSPTIDVRMVLTFTFRDSRGKLAWAKA